MTSTRYLRAAKPLLSVLNTNGLARSAAGIRSQRLIAGAAQWAFNGVFIQQTRNSSHSPLGTSSILARKKVTLQTLSAMYKRNEPITMITAHDFPSAHVADQAGMDMVLVGDSLAMVALGMEDTSEVLVEEMLLHCRSVSRGAKHTFIVSRVHAPQTSSYPHQSLTITKQVGDLPMGSYEISPAQAVATAIRFIKTGRVHSVKLEGGASMAPTIAAITAAGIPVVAHIGLTPQRQHALGGFRVQGKTAQSAASLLADARAVQDAGAFAVLLECVPGEVAALVTSKLRVPTIGIGAGNGCSGQVLVYVDMSGYFPPGRALPKFVKRYGDVWGEAMRAVEAYKAEVKSRGYPVKGTHTYPIAKEELVEFEKILKEEEGKVRDGK